MSLEFHLVVYSRLSAGKELVERLLGVEEGECDGVLQRAGHREPGHNVGVAGSRGSQTDLITQEKWSLLIQTHVSYVVNIDGRKAGK